MIEEEEGKFRIYCQKWSPRGLHPVEMVERTSEGVWNEGYFKKDEKGEWVMKVKPDVFPEMTEEWKRKYYSYKLRREFSRFFFTEHHDDDHLFDSELNINDVIKIIGKV